MRYSRSALLLPLILIVCSGPALAAPPSISVPEPGLTGIFVGGLLLGLAAIYRQRKK